MDTGSSLSLIGEAVLETERLNLKETITRLELALGAVLLAEALVRLYVRFAGKTRKHRFTLMSSSTDPVVLGRHFIADTKMTLDSGSKGFYFALADTFFPFSQPPLSG